jgi:hypothetical protein
MSVAIALRCFLRSVNYPRCSQIDHVASTTWRAFWRKGSCILFIASVRVFSFVSAGLAATAFLFRGLDAAGDSSSAAGDNAAAGGAFVFAVNFVFAVRFVSAASADSAVDAASADTSVALGVAGVAAADGAFVFAVRFVCTAAAAAAAADAVAAAERFLPFSLLIPSTEDFFFGGIFKVAVLLYLKWMGSEK